MLNSYYHPYIGGAETYVRNLSRTLAEMGHQVTVYCADRPLTAGVSYDGRVKVIRMDTPLLFYGTPLVRFPRSLFAGSYDVVHCNFPNPYFAAVSAAISRWNGTPAVLTWHNDLPVVTNSALAVVHLHDLVSPLYLDAYSRIIATTATYAQTSRTLRRYRGKTRIILNGVDTRRFNPEASCENVKAKYNLAGHKTLIFVGALTAWHSYKGVDVLIRAFAAAKKNCKALKLMIVGGGSLLEYYRGMAKGVCEPGSVVFTGRVEDNVLPALYNASDFAVLPSVSSSEGFGLVLLEAMASGKAVIGSNVGGIPELVHHGENGLLVSPGDQNGLTEAIVRLCSDDDSRIAMGNTGLQFAAQHDWKTVAGKTERLYGSIALLQAPANKSMDD